jgi:hypothetical protein
MKFVGTRYVRADFTDFAYLPPPSGRIMPPAGRASACCGIEGPNVSSRE